MQLQKCVREPGEEEAPSRSLTSLVNGLISPDLDLSPYISFKLDIDKQACFIT